MLTAFVFFYTFLDRALAAEILSLKVSKAAQELKHTEEMQRIQLEKRREREELEHQEALLRARLQSEAEQR